MTKHDGTITVQTDLSLTNAGSIQLSESLPQANPNAPVRPYTAVLVSDEAEVFLSLRIDEDQPPDTVIVEMCSSDDTNKETGRSFHSAILIALSLDQIMAVRHFLTYLIDTRTLVMPR